MTAPRSSGAGRTPWALRQVRYRVAQKQSRIVCTTTLIPFSFPFRSKEAGTRFARGLTVQRARRRRTPTSGCLQRQTSPLLLSSSRILIQSNPILPLLPSLPHPLPSFFPNPSLAEAPDSPHIFQVTTSPLVPCSPPSPPSLLLTMSERDSKRPRTDGAGGGPIENPYLAHLNEPHQRTYGGGQAAGGAAPLDGWIARKITGKMVEKAMVRFFLLPFVSSFFDALGLRGSERRVG